MGKSKSGVEYFARIALLLIYISGTVSNWTSGSFSYFLVCLLVYLLNSQLRITFLKGRLSILSIFLEIGIIYYIHTQFGGLSYLLLYIPVLDALIAFREEGYAISVLVLGLMYYLLKEKSMEVLFLNGAIFLVLFVFILQVRRLRHKVEEVEALFDENRRYSYQLEDVKKRLEEHSKKVEQVSQLEERNRISREIHDTVGHRLTGLYMQLEASLRVLELDGEKGREMLGQVRDNLSACIDVLRQTVRNLKPKDYSSRLLTLEEMMGSFARQSGVQIGFTVVGSPVKLYPSAELTLYKNAQEALTNAVRHGKARNIKVTLEYREREVLLTVEDDGQGCTGIVMGMGLSGMQERAGLIGGRMEFESSRGFTVKTFVPIRE